MMIARSFLTPEENHFLPHCSVYMLICLKFVFSIVKLVYKKFCGKDISVVDCGAALYRTGIGVPEGFLMQTNEILL